jgi:hypothetical protein
MAVYTTAAGAPRLVTAPGPKVWDPESDEPLYHLAGYTGWVQAVVVFETLEARQCLATAGGSAADVRVWDLAELPPAVTVMRSSAKKG